MFLAYILIVAVYAAALGAFVLSSASFDAGLGRLAVADELDMRRLAERSRAEEHRELLALTLFAASTLLLTLLIARRLARGLSRPLIRIAGELSRPRGFEEPLALPESDSRELEVLRLRLEDWWDQIRRFQQLKDVTERRRRERLEEEFIGVLSHELKTPLQSLGMAAELMDKRRGSMDEAQRVLLDTMLDDLRRIRAVANDFVQVSRLNMRGIRLNLELVPLADKLDEWLRPFRLLAAERGASLTLERGRDSGLCRLDPVKFSWVVSNLLSNALRVSSAGHAVRVKVEDQTLFVEMRVEDEGPGVPPEVERRMFEPYFQGPPESQAAGLLGLGLTIAKEVVEAHEGAIEYYRGEPRGSVFRVLLPAVPRPRSGAPL